MSRFVGYRTTGAALLLLVSMQSIAACSYECKAIFFPDGLSIVLPADAARAPAHVCFDERCFSDSSPEGEGQVRFVDALLVASWQPGKMPYP